MAVLDEIRPAVRDRHVGGTRVIDVTVEMREDSQGVDALFFTLVLGDPPEGHASWPLEDLRELRDVMREAVSRSNPPLPWYLSFEPEHPELEEDDPQLHLDV